MTTVWQWCSSRSSMLVAVVCSGRNRAPGLERPVRSDADGAAFVSGGDESEEELGCGVV